MSALVLEVDHLRAALCCAAKEDVRFYLNGAQVEIGPDFVTYVGTDGRMLFACSHQADDVPAHLVGTTFVLHRDCLKKLKGAQTFELTEIDAAAGRVIGKALGKKVNEPGVQLEVIDARYPDWRMVVPSEVTGQLDHYDPALFVAVWKAFIELGCPAGVPPHVHHNGVRGKEGGKAAVLTMAGAPWALGVVMPFKSIPDDIASRHSAVTRDLKVKAKKTRTPKPLQPVPEHAVRDPLDDAGADLV